MTLDFTGDLNPWLGLLLAGLFAVGTWRVYRREVGGGRVAGAARWLMPLVRVFAVVLILLMLVGPVFSWRATQQQPGRVIVFIDPSESMAMNDKYMDAGRKLLIARAQGWLADGVIDPTLYDLALALREARTTVDHALANQKGVSVTDIARRFQEQLVAVRDRLEKVDATLLPTLGGKAGDSDDPGATAAGGGVLREYWLDVPGERVSDLRNSPRFAGPPSGTNVSDLFETPSNLGDNYGTRLRGYIHPPVTGAYTFWITSDGPSELWVSLDELPTTARIVARVTAFTAPRAWAGGEQQSQAVRLEGGKRYYIEAIHKEGTGDDHLAVGWQLPVGSFERPIPGRRLSPFVALAVHASGNPGGAVSSGPASAPAAIAQSFANELVSPLESLLAHAESDDKTGLARRADLAAVSAVAHRWESMLHLTFNAHARRMAASGGSAADAIVKVDAATRWQRMSALLMNDDGLVRRLADHHAVEVHALKPGESQLLWFADRAADAPAALALEPTETVSDLASGLARVGQRRGAAAGAAASSGSGEPPALPDSTGSSDSQIPALRDDENVSIVLLTDGQHNLDASNPRSSAAMLADRGIAVYTVGFGSLEKPEDLAIRSVDAPQSVFHEDRVTGEILLNDDMPPGLPFTLKIEHEGKTIWEKRLVTERSAIRRVSYDFAIKEIVEAQRAKANAGGDVKLINVPLPLKVSVTPVEGESEPGNNEGAFVVHGITEPRKVLIIDGRPRWESRYLRNLFERDQRWQVNALIAGTKLEGAAWRRGHESGAFPPDLESLLKYDLIILGDVPRGLVTDEELSWLRDFVGDRGGGLIVIDGQRGHLRSYGASPIGEVLPIEWAAAAAGDESGGVRPARLKLTAAGQNLVPLRLVSDPLDNAGLWTELQPPHWAASVKALPGAETIVEAVAGERTLPAVVQRSYGAGRVLYCAFDESWRWRYEVGDLYHARFWNQVGKWVGEQPYAVQDRFAKLDAGKPTYQPGEKAEIRARVRDRDGKPMLKATVTAHVHRDGKRIASVPLQPADNRGGVYRGETGALEPGKYEIGLSVSGLDDGDLKARARFDVEAALSLERRSVVMDEDLLRQMASRGGRYYREEDAKQLIQRLEPAVKGKIVHAEIVLWRSWWWFIPIVTLLTIEWLLRKRAGML